MKEARYPRKSQHPSVDRAVAALAHRQHGYVTRQQLLGLGPSRDAVQRQVRTPVA
jgi:hypothetical protein